MHKVDIMTLVHTDLPVTWEGRDVGWFDVMLAGLLHTGGPAACHPVLGGRDVQSCGTVPQGWGAGSHAERRGEELYPQSSESGQVRPDIFHKSGHTSHTFFTNLVVLPI